MKTQIKQTKSKQPLIIYYSRQMHGWMLEKKYSNKVFESRQAIESFCLRKLGRLPKTKTPSLPEEYQTLPRRSVWTGAPWDHNFANLY